LPPFSALLVKIARDADESSKRVIALTEALRWLTWALVVLTGALLAFEGVPAILALKRALGL
jgi:hypothetical protein